MPSKRSPLQELPLSYFDTPSSRANPFKPATKRSRSPGALLTPAKRRILRAEGIMPSPSSSTSSSSSSRGRSPNVDAGPSMRIDASTPSMPPSPRTRSERARLVVATAPPSGAYRTRSSTASLEPSPIASPTSSGSRRAQNPIMVPRCVPSPQDPQSEHYPGFEIHYDTHIPLRSVPTRQYSLEAGDGDASDVSKENFPPRKKVKKAISAPENDPGLSLEIPSKLHASSQPITPFSASPILTPQTPLHILSPHAIEKPSPFFTPGRTPRSGTDFFDRRRAMEMEVDDTCDDEEDPL